MNKPIENLESALAVLRNSFALNEFRPKQVEVIEHVLAGRNVLALLPTGYGKSICYQVPSQILPGVTIVVSPLIALMQDQLAGLARRGITNATVLNSTLDYHEMTERIDGIRRGDYKLVYVAPERFESPRFRALLRGVNVSLMVIDEAHCISQWGHDFRPQYRNLGQYIREFNSCVLAVTATATPTVKVDIVRNLELPSIEFVEGSFDRKNLAFSVRSFKGAAAKESFVKEALRAIPGTAIIYTSSRKEAENVGRFLMQSGHRAGFYHAGLEAPLRAKVQRAFEADQLDIIVCTVAFGMGVDKPNIRQVIHYNLPSAVESYYQEAGRAGRDGQPALCTLMYQPKDIYIQKWLLDKKEISEDLRRVDRHRLDAMIAYAQSPHCRRKQLLGYFGQSLKTCTGCDVCTIDPARSVAALQAAAGR